MSAAVAAVSESDSSDLSDSGFISTSRVSEKVDATLVVANAAAATAFPFFSSAFPFQHTPVDGADGGESDSEADRRLMACA